MAGLKFKEANYRDMARNKKRLNNWEIMVKKDLSLTGIFT